jgi:15-cis-phytoene synthase
MSDVNERNERIFRQGSKTFYNSTRFFPAEVRGDITTLYAFVRIGDQFVDTIPQQPVEFGLFRKELLDARDGKLVSSPIIIGFVELEQRRNFDPKWADAFLDSMEMDLTKSTYANFEEVKTYCYGSAAVIGLFVACIVGASAESYPHAESLGYAFQLINFIRDIEEDRRDLGRCYMPQDDMAEFGLTDLSKEEALANPQGFASLLERQIVRYQGLQLHGLAGIHYLPVSVRSAILTAADM